MARDRHRDFKDRLYGQFARIGKALSSPHRLEILELLAQGKRTVDSLATEIGLSRQEYVAYCRGPYCVSADRAVEILRSRGRHARRRLEGFPEWRAADFLVESGSRPEA